MALFDFNPYHAAASEVSKTSIVHCSGTAPALTAGVAVMLLCLRRLLGQEKHTLSIEIAGLLAESARQPSESSQRHAGRENEPRHAGRPDFGEKGRGPSFLKNRAMKLYTRRGSKWLDKSTFCPDPMGKIACSFQRNRGRAMRRILIWIPALVAILVMRVSFLADALRD